MNTKNLSMHNTSKDSNTDNSKSDARVLEKSMIFLGENGLHARPASHLSKMAKKFPNTEIMLWVQGKSAAMKSMTSILKLNIKPQTEITVSACGEDAEQALVQIISYFESELNNEKATVIENK